MSKTRPSKTLRGVSEVRVLFSLVILHPDHAPTGISVERLQQEMKLKLLKTDVLMCAWLLVCVCVCLTGVHINKSTNWREEGCQRVAGFVNVLSPLKVTHLGDEEAYVKGDFE